MTADISVGSIPLRRGDGEILAAVTESQIVAEIKNTPRNAAIVGPNLQDYTHKLDYARTLVNEALKQRRIFCIQGCYPVIRYMLKKRGWLERDWRFTVANPVPESTNFQPSHRLRRKAAQEICDPDDDGDLDDADYDTPDFKQLDKDLVGYEKGINNIEPSSLEGICARMLKDLPPDKCYFFWTIRTTGISLKNLTRHQSINHFPGASFTTKSGIMDILNNHLKWACDQSPNDFFPRCYKLSNSDDRRLFLQDYRICTAICIINIFKRHKEDNLKTVAGQAFGSDLSHVSGASHSSTPRSGGNWSVDSSPYNSPRPGKTRQRKRARQAVEAWVLDKAIEIITERIDELNDDSQSVFEDGVGEAAAAGVATSSQSRDDVSAGTPAADGIAPSTRKLEREVSDEDRAFYAQYYRLAHHEARFEATAYLRFSLDDINCYVRLIDDNMEDYQQDIIGYHNLWIVKPGAKSRGRGITVQSRIMDILRSYVGTGEPNLQKDGRWIIQKYIERPLLIHETKFDIRQWFMIDNFSPLKIWSYRDAYLRFSSRKFSLIDHSQAVHLCNYSIQKNYDDAGERSAELPEDNMWTNAQFDQWYYDRFNIATIWESQVWLQMTGIMEKVMLSALESGNMESAGKMKSSFELYGADFMLTIGSTGKIKVWLIELNSSPTMALSSSSATHKLCRSVQEDTVRLILSDAKSIISEGTRFGGYELTYCGSYSQKIPTYSGQAISLQGKPFKKAREPRKPKMFRIPGENFRRSIDGKKVEQDGDSEAKVDDSDTAKEKSEPKSLMPADDGEETSSESFARRLSLRKVSATRSNEHNNIRKDNGRAYTPNMDVLAGRGNTAFTKLKRITSSPSKGLPKIEKPLVPPREHMIKSNTHLMMKPNEEKKRLLMKLPMRRTPMAVALCTSQHDNLHHKGKGLIVADPSNSPAPSLDRGKAKLTAKERALEQDMVKILASARSKNEAMEKLVNMPFLLKSQQQPQQYLTSPTPQLTKKSSNTYISPKTSRPAVNQNSNTELNYSLHVNGAKQKRMKTYVIDPRKYLSRTMTDPTKFPSTRSSAYSKIPVATVGELPSRKQKTVSVVDMTSCLHSGHQVRTRQSMHLRRKERLSKTNVVASTHGNYKDFGIAKIQNRLGADYFWMNPH